MLEYLILTLSVIAAGTVGVGTIFGSSKWDRITNPDSRLACYHREISDSELVIAHNHLPCGTRVWLFNPRTGRSTTAVVGDRGPRHALVDLSKGVARQLGHNGKEQVLLVPLPQKSSHERDLLRSLVEGDPDRPLPTRTALRASEGEPTPGDNPADPTDVN